MIKIKISAVIAVYNEKENIAELTDRLDSALKKLKCDYEIIYFVDGNDGTFELLKKIQKKVPKVRPIFGSKKPLGLGYAFRKAFKAASKNADYVLTMDADLNHQPEEIKRLLKALNETNADIVVGSRQVAGSIRTDTPFIKKLISNLTNSFFTLAFGVKTKDKTSGFRLYKKASLMKLNYEANNFEFLPEMLMIAQKNRMKIVEVPITFKFRKKGVSKLRWGQTFKGYMALIFKKIFK